MLRLPTKPTETPLTSFPVLPDCSPAAWHSVDTTPKYLVGRSEPPGTELYLLVPGQATGWTLQAVVAVVAAADIRRSVLRSYKEGGGGAKEL